MITNASYYRFEQLKYSLRITWNGKGIRGVWLVLLFKHTKISRSLLDPLHSIFIVFLNFAGLRFASHFQLHITRKKSLLCTKFRSLGNYHRLTESYTGEIFNNLTIKTYSSGSVLQNISIWRQTNLGLEEYNAPECKML